MRQNARHEELSRAATARLPPVQEVLPILHSPAQPRLSSLLQRLLEKDGRGLSVFNVMR